MIIQHSNKILRQKSAEVPAREIGELKIQNIIKRMKEALILNIKENKGGIALAAPQIGYNLRIFIILKDVLKISEKTNHPARTAAFKEFQETAGRNEPQFFIFINPKIIKKSKKKQILEEGCLSVEGIFGKIKRPEKITVEAFDENGKKFQMSGAKIMAEAIEHETDHLDGILFIDKIMKNL